MQCAIPIRRVAGLLLVAAVLTSLVLSPAAHAAPGAVTTSEDGPTWVQRLPGWLMSWAEPFLDLLPGSGADTSGPVSVYDEAGGQFDPDGSAGADAESTELEGPTVGPSTTDASTG